MTFIIQKLSNEKKVHRSILNLTISYVYKHLFGAFFLVVLDDKRKYTIVPVMHCLQKFMNIR